MEFIDPRYCAWDTEPFLMVFSDNVFGNFIYYSHLLPILCTILLVGTLWWQNRYHKATQALMFMTVMFTAWSFSDLILWSTADPLLTMFYWSIILHFEVLIYVGALYFISYFVNGRRPRWKFEAALLVFYLPLIVFSHTPLNLAGYDYTNCYREAVENHLVLYAYFLEVLMALGILYIGVRHFFRAKGTERNREVLLGTIGTSLFLLSFSLGNIVGTFGVDWELGQYGLFGLPLFVAMLVYLIIRYNSLNAKLFGAQALVSGIFIMVVSLLFLRSLENIHIVTLLTAPVILLLGFFLVRSVKREIEQKQLAQQLATELAGVNARLERLDKMKSEFVSIASHQLRSPLTSIRGYVSMILEGSYGEFSDKTKAVLERVDESARLMALSIDDFLNVSRIEAGNMSYDLVDVDVRTIVEDIVSVMQPISVERSMPLKLTATFEGPAASKLDVGKARQIIQNMVDNAFKYTREKGNVEVTLRKDEKNKMVHVDVKDQGIGLSSESIEHLFEKFERAKNASSANVSGSGLGLYIARTMVRAMGGDITVSSQGEGKGSTFTASFPLNGIDASWKAAK